MQFFKKLVHHVRSPKSCLNTNIPNFFANFRSFFVFTCKDYIRWYYVLELVYHCDFSDYPIR